MEGSADEVTRRMNKLIYAGLVSYNPDLSRLKENINSIITQVDIVVVYENGSENQNEVCKELENFKNIKVIAMKKNNGIAAALNTLMEWGLEHDFLWMLSLDQDSVCGGDYISKMLPYLSIEQDIGIVAPVIVDRNIGVVGHQPKNLYTHVNTCITSGAIVNIYKWKEVGRYDEWMFIDSVDFEFCYRMRKKGYGVIQIQEVELLHEIGKSQERKFLFWNVRVSGHSAFRKYYIARNNIYYPMKHHLYLFVIRGHIRNFWLLIKTLLYEADEKSKKIRAILSGWKDGMIGVKHEN